MSSQLVVKTAKLAPSKGQLLVIYANQVEDGQPTLCGEGARIWAATELDWDRHCAAASFEGKAGQVLDLIAPEKIDVDRLFVLGAGTDDIHADHADRKTGHLAKWADRGGSLLSKIEGTKLNKVSVILDSEIAAADEIAELAAGLHLRHYRFDKFKSAKPNDKDTSRKISVTLNVDDKPAVDKAINSRDAVAKGTLMARDLVNEPANTLGPVEFAQIAGDLSSLGIKTEILTTSDMEALGMGSLLCVAQGSPRPARMVIMQWNGGKKSDQPLAFVGKGVCFDSGGISIKPAGSMEDMKGDMGGAAAVTGLMKALALRKAPVNVVGVIGLAENMPDGLSVRPGDIVTAMSGTTIEVVNTDAEGRLVLADALWYTQDRFKPKFMINLATLTGAILVALGRDHAGIFSNNDELSENLYAAGLETGEKVWRLPLGPAYDKLIESRFADIKNVGGRLGGSITAGQFLQRFVNDVPWAHIDIAATAFAVSPTAINRSWAPGFGVALLDRLIRDNYEG